MKHGKPQAKQRDLINHPLVLGPGAFLDLPPPLAGLEDAAAVLQFHPGGCHLGGTHQAERFAGDQHGMPSFLARASASCSISRWSVVVGAGL